MPTSWSLIIFLTQDWLMILLRLGKSQVPGPGYIMDNFSKEAVNPSIYADNS